jgi:hypothetical protein
LYIVINLPGAAAELLVTVEESERGSLAMSWITVSTEHKYTINQRNQRGAPWPSAK